MVLRSFCLRANLHMNDSSLLTEHKKYSIFIVRKYMLICRLCSKKKRCGKAVDEKSVAAYHLALWVEKEVTGFWSSCSAHKVHLALRWWVTALRALALSSDASTAQTPCREWGGGVSIVMAATVRGWLTHGAAWRVKCVGGEGDV